MIFVEFFSFNFYVLCLILLNFYSQGARYMSSKPPLHRAAWDGDVVLVKRLLDEGHSLSEVSDYDPVGLRVFNWMEDVRCTALAVAVHRGNIGVVKVLANHHQHPYTVCCIFHLFLFHFHIFYFSFNFCFMSFILLHLKIVFFV